MISQRCPKCLSQRVRQGYRPTPFWSKLLLRYNLLCDSCNWEFIGFAVPGTISYKPSRKNKTKSTADSLKNEPEETFEEDNTPAYKIAAASKK